MPTFAFEQKGVKELFSRLVVQNIKVIVLSVADKTACGVFVVDVFVSNPAGCPLILLSFHFYGEHLTAFLYLTLLILGIAFLLPPYVVPRLVWKWIFLSY